MFCEKIGPEISVSDRPPYGDIYSKRDETYSVPCKYYAKEVTLEQNNRSETKYLSKTNKTYLNFWLRLDLFTWNDCHTGKLTDYKKRRLFFYGRLIHMEIDWRQNIKAKLFVRRFGPNVLSPFDIHLVLVTIEATNTSRIHRKHYCEKVNPKHEIQSKTNHLSGDKKINLNFLFPIEFLVIYQLHYGNAYREQN